MSYFFAFGTFIGLRTSESSKDANPSEKLCIEKRERRLACEHAIRQADALKEYGQGVTQRTDPCMLRRRVDNEGEEKTYSVYFYT